eukprot:757291-Hanusia_phi.AAC.3
MRNGKGSDSCVTLSSCQPLLDAMRLVHLDYQEISRLLPVKHAGCVFRRRHEPLSPQSAQGGCQIQPPGTE